MQSLSVLDWHQVLRLAIWLKMSCAEPHQKNTSAVRLVHAVQDSARYSEAQPPPQQKTYISDPITVTLDSASRERKE